MKKSSERENELAERNSEIIRLWNSGMSQIQIAEKFHISQGRISIVLKQARENEIEVRKANTGRKNVEDIEKLEAEIVELWNSGMPRKEISDKIHVSNRTIANALEKAKEKGIYIKEHKRGRKKSTKAEKLKEEIVELWNSGMTQRNIARNLHVSIATIRKALQEARKKGIEVRKANKGRKNVENIEKLEAEIVKLWNSGMSRKEISGKIHVSNRTIANALEKAKENKIYIRESKRGCQGSKSIEERNAKIIELWNSGMIQRDISENLHVSIATIGNILREARKKGIQVKKANTRRKNVEDIEKLEAEIVELWNSGMSREEISDKIHVSIAAIGKVLREVRKKGIYIRESKRGRKKSEKAEKLEEEIVRLHNSGMKQRDIAKKIHTSTTTIKDALKKAKEKGIYVGKNTRGRNASTEERNAKIVELWNLKMSYKDIANKLHISQSTVNIVLKQAYENGLEVRDGRKRKKKTQQTPLMQSNEEDKKEQCEEDIVPKLEKPQPVCSEAKPTVEQPQKTKPHPITRIYRKISIDENLATRIKELLKEMLPRDVARTLRVKPNTVYDLFDSLTDEEQKQIKKAFIAQREHVYSFVKKQKKDNVSAARALKMLETKESLLIGKELSETYFALGDFKAAIRVLNQIGYSKNIDGIEKKLILEQKEKIQTEITSQSVRKEFYTKFNMDGTKISWDDLCKKYKVRTSFLIDVIGTQREAPTL